jgi:hypothetical protein
MSGTAKTHVNPLKSWLDKFKLYLSTSEVIPEGMDTIAWWGVRKKLHRGRGFFANWVSISKTLTAILSGHRLPEII